MRTIAAQDLKVLALPARTEVAVVETKDADGAWRDLTSLAGTDWLIEPPTWGAPDALDAPVTEMRVRLWRNQFYFSLAANLSTSKLNRNAAGAYSPLLDLNRDIRVRGRIWPEGNLPTSADLDTLWQGRISDIDDQSSETEISLTCEGLAARIKDTWIETERIYGSAAGVPLETVIQSILTDNVSPAVALYTPASPAFDIKPEYTQQQTSTLDACMVNAALRGWIAAYKWDAGTGTERFTLYDPNRSSTTSLFTFAKPVYTRTRFARSLTNIRNVIEVSYRDTADGIRKSVTVTDAASISKYGRRYGKMIEGDNSPINNATQATTYANAALSDLKDPKAELAAIVDWFPWVEVGDIYTFAADGEAYDTDQKLAVVGFEHGPGGTDGRLQTTMQLRGSPAGAYAYWLRKVVPVETDTLARIQLALPSFNGSAFSVAVTGNDKTDSLWYQEPAVSSTWVSFATGANSGTFSGTASSSAPKAFNIAGKNKAGELGPSVPLTVNKFVPSTNNLECTAAVIAADATTVTVQVFSTSGGTVVYNGVSGSATKASGPGVGVGSASGTTWVFNRGAFGAGSGQASFTASALGYVSDTDFAEIPEQGRDTVGLVMRASVISSSVTQVVVRVAVADPYPSANVSIAYAASGTGSVTPASPQTILAASITNDITTTGYVDFTIARGAGAGTGRVTFTATATGRVSDSDAVDVPQAAIQPPVHQHTQTAVTATTETWSLNGSVGSGGTGPAQVQVEAADGTVLTAWTNVALSRSFTRGVNDTHYRIRLRDSSAGTPLEADAFDLVIESRRYLKKGAESDPDTLDGVPEGSTYRRLKAGAVDVSGNADFGGTAWVNRHAGNVARSGANATTIQTIVGQLADTGHLGSGMQDSGGRPVNRFVAKAASTDPDTLDGVPEGSTYKRVKAGATDGTGKLDLGGTEWVGRYGTNLTRKSGVSTTLEQLTGLSGQQWVTYVDPGVTSDNPVNGDGVVRILVAGGSMLNGGSVVPIPATTMNNVPPSTTCYIYYDATAGTVNFVLTKSATVDHDRMYICTIVSHSDTSTVGSNSGTQKETL